MLAKTKRNFIIGSCVSSGLALIISFVALGTEEWVGAELSFTDQETLKRSEVNYGLFGGTLMHYLGSTSYYEITMTCSSEYNACAQLCKSSGEERDKELELLASDSNDVYFDTNCPRVQRNVNPLNDAIPKSPREGHERTFINMGLYASTIFFLVVSIVFGAFSTGLSVWNAVANPIQVFLNITGLLIYNGIALGCTLLTVILWSAEYLSTLTDNVGILYTVKGEMDTLQPYLGYSYWINFASIVLYGCSLGLLATRQILINKEPEPANIEPIQDNSGALMLF